jgi:hypothetical protein
MTPCNAERTEILQKQPQKAWETAWKIGEIVKKQLKRQDKHNINNNKWLRVYQVI